MKLQFRKADFNDAQLYFDWANDLSVRKNSFNQSEISYNQHIKWFTNKLNSKECSFYIFFNEQTIPIGQVRIDKSNNEFVVGISIDKNFRGNGFALEILNTAIADYLEEFPLTKINAYVKKENLASLKLFTKANFTKVEELEINNCACFKFQKN